jgi:Protein of unknown function (DUF4011)/AAA domain
MTSARYRAPANDRASVSELPPQGVHRALEDARREMLDLTRRNRLLHAPVTGKRPWCMPIDGNVERVFDALVRRESARLPFAARPSAANEDISPQSSTPTVELIESADQPDNEELHETALSATADAHTADQQSTKRRSRIVLQTRLTQEQLDRRLNKIYRDARSLEEEQGLSTLFLAIGFLHWYDRDDSEEESAAPLILVPVHLERVRDADRYVLASRDDDLVTNISLQEKLRQAFGITLPDLPDGDDWSVAQYLLSVTAAIQQKHRWSVQHHEVGLGFFTFSKFLMWKDLDPKTWSQQQLLSHPLLRNLLGTDTLSDEGSPLVSDEEPIDDKINLARTVHIVDADSSQAVIVEEAKRRRNLVVQGPPGTGKSQTITNIIASAAHAGLSVLFVAEKTTALEVVHKRLRQAGLGPLCLEMHSRKASKREVLRSLDEALHTATTARTDARVAESLAIKRDRLNSASAAMHRPIGRTNRLRHFTWWECS